jgi:hypothetical protein
LAWPKALQAQANSKKQVAGFRFTLSFLNCGFAATQLLFLFENADFFQPAAF